VRRREGKGSRVYGRGAEVQGSFMFVSPSLLAEGWRCWREARRRGEGISGT
jgi:hypothetical protein